MARGFARGGPVTASRRALPIAVAILLLLSLAPSRFTSPLLGPVSDVATFLSGPIQAPMTALVNVFRRRDSAGSTDPKIAQLKEDLESYKALYFRKTAEVKRLEEVIVELQLAGAVNADVPVRLIYASVIGRGGDLSSTALKVRAGAREGVEPNAVAVVNAVQVVGRVQEGVRDRFCWVLPITDRRAQPIKGAIMLDDATIGPDCPLKASGGGELIGPVEWKPGMVAPPEIRPGMRVRLNDDTWPRHAQGLVLGEVESVRTLPNGRLEATVRPAVRLDQVSEVLLRLTGESEHDSLPAGGQL
ncbi:MAG: hypothetical protein H7Y88_01950 [Phycisphaerales bacterium]|nr:hypothetical protein [Phycisphaerales bacterium]